MANWDKQAVKAAIEGNGWHATERPIQGAIQFMLMDGTRVNYHDTNGTVHVQGKDTPIKRKAEEVFAGSVAASGARTTAAAPVSGLTPTTLPAAAGATATTPKSVFIVYGHDTAARDDLELLLRRLDLKPIILGNMAGSSNTIIEMLEQKIDADFACVLITPDDEGRKRATDDEQLELRPRARQNVVLELGMVLARLRRDRVAILVKGDEIERPSDIDGLIYISFSESVHEAKNDIADNLERVGFNISVSGLNT